MTAPAIERRQFMPRADLFGLTPRERTALEHAADGLTLPLIGEEMHILPTTVESHLSAARTKLGARNTVHAVAIAIRYGVIL